jgi:hypothetical protein
VTFSDQPIAPSRDVALGLTKNEGEPHNVGQVGSKRASANAGALFLSGVDKLARQLRTLGVDRGNPSTASNA